MDDEKKMTTFREISRLFSKEEASKEILSKAKRIVNFRIEELKRETVYTPHHRAILTVCCLLARSKIHNINDASHPNTRME